MNADSRDFAVEEGDEMRETRMAWARGIVGGDVACAMRDVGWERLAYNVGGRWIWPGELIGEVYIFTERVDLMSAEGCRSDIYYEYMDLWKVVPSRR